MQTTATHHMEGFTNGSRCILEIFDQVQFRLWIVLFWTKTSQRLTLYLLSSLDNIHIVLENDNTVLIKGLKKVVNVKFSKALPSETSYDRLKSREIISAIRKILLKQEFSDGLQISMNIKRYYYTFDNSLLFSGNRN